jgi:hypothetical protein
MSTPDLPAAETLYAVFFAPWFDPADPREPRLRSDIEEIELPPGTHPRTLCELNPDERRQVESYLAGITQAALSDLPALLNLEGDPTPAWFDALEAKATPAQLQAWLQSSNPQSPQNNYLLLTCELGALIAVLLQRNHPGLRWIEDLPYFESCLFDLNRRVRIPVFHWAVKTLSGDTETRIREKFEASLKYLRAE